MEVCFHGPGRRGWPDLETAREVMLGFEAQDKLMNRSRIYEIQTVAVASDFEDYLQEVYLPEGFHNETEPSTVGDLTDEEAKSLDAIIKAANEPATRKGEKSN